MENLQRIFELSGIKTTLNEFAAPQPQGGNEGPSSFEKSFYFGGAFVVYIRFAQTQDMQSGQTVYIAQCVGNEDDDADETKNITHHIRSFQSAQSDQESVVAEFTHWCGENLGTQVIPE